MSTIAENQPSDSAFPFPTDWSMADLLIRLGDIPAERIRLYPPLGQATVEDVQRIQEKEGRLYELDLGVLVEKPMVWYESIIGVLVSTIFRKYLEQHPLGTVLGADGSLKILPKVVKIPDVAFVSWGRFPKKKLPRGPIPHLIPDLVVEVLSDSNTQKEMQLKLEEYFEAGVLLVWYVDPETRAATAYTSARDGVRIEPSGHLDGGSVLPGFTLSLKWLFEKADRARPAFEASDSEEAT